MTVTPLTATTTQPTAAHDACRCDYHQQHAAAQQTAAAGMSALFGQPTATLNDGLTQLRDSLQSFLQLFSAPELPTQTLTPKIKDGQITVNTEDGYSIACSGKNQEWTITAPDGKTTRIWGDPHVVESDADTWDFKSQSSFVFGNNKITIETTPYTNNPDTTVTKTISIYNGDDRVSITDIDKDTPRLSDWHFDAGAHDANLEDGDVYALAKEDNGDERWEKSAS